MREVKGKGTSMSTVISHRTHRHQVHLPVDVPRRTVAAFIVVVGVVLVVTTFANNLFKVGPSFETMIDDFRPQLATAQIETARADLAGFGATGSELQTKMIPAMAAQLGMTPAQFSAYIAQDYPQVASGMESLPQIVTTFNGLVTTLDEQGPLFRSADAIPTKDLPATTVPWSLLAAGILTMAAGAFVWFSPRPGAVVALVLGGLLIAAPIAMSLLQKASDADQLNSNLKPVYTAALLTQADAALTTVSAMGSELQDTMLPALAKQLKMQPAQLQQFLGENFPATAASLQDMPAAMGRFQGLVFAFDENLGNYNTVKPVSFVPIIWTLILGGALTALLGLVILVMPKHKAVTIG